MRRTSLEIRGFQPVGESTRIENLDGNCYTITSEPTIKGATHRVTLNMVRLGAFNGPVMGYRVAHCGEGKINHKDFGMSFSMMLDGRLIVSDEVQILLQGEVIEKGPEASANTW